MKHTCKLFFIIIMFATTQTMNSIDPNILTQKNYQQDPQSVAANAASYGLGAGIIVGAATSNISASMAAGTLATAIGTYVLNQGAPNYTASSDTQWLFWGVGLSINFALAAAINDAPKAAALTTLIMSLPFIWTQEENRLKQTIEEWKLENGYCA